jgi:hypothetical protein
MIIHADIILSTDSSHATAGVGQNGAFLRLFSF